MSKPKLTRLDRLRQLVQRIESHGDPAEQTAMAEFLNSFATRNRVRSQPL